MKRRDHKYDVELCEEQRYLLHQLISSGKAPARQLAHARILLKIDPLITSVVRKVRANGYFKWHVPRSLTTGVPTTVSQ